MFKELQMKIAARRVAKKRKARSQKNTRFWNIITRPFQAIWGWCRSIDLIGLVNITLLSAIIVLFSMLIIDIVGCRRINSVLNVAQNTSVVAKSDVPDAHYIPVRSDQVTALPLSRDSKGVSNIRVSVVRPRPCPVAARQTARVQNDMYGDVIIDSRGAATMLQSETVINGNLYLQNMRKYVLPCGIKVNGNLFMRDVNMLQFCGEFTVTGNIYVSPKSSFGPLPRSARIGGQVII